MVMKKILKGDFGPAVAVVIDLLVAYLFFILARVAFLVENHTLFADTLSEDCSSTRQPSSISTPYGSR